MKVLKKICDWFAMLMTGKCDFAVDKEICDFSGQGHDKYGR